MVGHSYEQIPVGYAGAWSFATDIMLLSIMFATPRSFTRVTRGHEAGSYYHPLFQRGKEKLCKDMTCNPSPGPKSNEYINPVALGIVTPAMIQMGLVDPESSSETDDMA
jgi:hypothetical protein